ncbi:MAG: radical SAM protein [Thermoproteota archaeon]
MYKTYKAKRILNIHKHCDGGWFWNKYSASPYIGCEWGCEYCYSRDEKYNPHHPSRDPQVLKFGDAFSQYIRVKENAPELLRNELKNKPRDLIYLDSYQPVEEEYRYVRGMLEVCLESAFPVFINEKSPMLLRDLDVLKRISESSCLNVGWSIITTEDDEVRRMFEPKAPTVSSRFAAMKKLTENKITTGTVFMPILPFIYDDDENIEAVVRRTEECGGQYILEGGLTLWGYCKTHFYKVLKKYDPALIRKYEQVYRNPKLLAEHTSRIHRLVVENCKKYGLTPYIPRPIDIYPEELRVNKRIAEMLYLKARELQLSGEETYRKWAYKKAAWSLDESGESVKTIFRRQGIEGIMQIEGIGRSLAVQIEAFLNEFKT